ncbi:MAG: N-acetyltransferase family protein [Bacteroidota bacterium]
MQESSLNGITYVSTKEERKAFLDFPYSFYEGEPNWVAPLYMDQKKLINTEKNAFYDHADIDLFLAEKDGQIAGRIAAIHDRNYNQYNDAKAGFFGFFECINDPAVAKLLFRVVKDWMTERGLTEMLGPTSPGMMDTIGVLTEGFEYLPSILMPYNKPYYDSLMKEVGLEKAMDMYAYRVSKETVALDHIERADKIVRRRLPSLNIREINMRKLNREVGHIMEIFNESWANNWGFSPLSRAEFDQLAKDLKMVVDTDYAHIAEVDGRPVAFSIALPDYNQALQHLDGRLFPTGIFKLLYHRRNINQLRTALMGVRPKYQGKGIDALLHKEAISNGLENGFVSAELSWILETNTEMIRVAERIGGHVEKTYRMYRADL